MDIMEQENQILDDSTKQTKVKKSKYDIAIENSFYASEDILFGTKRNFKRYPKNDSDSFADETNSSKKKIPNKLLKKELQDITERNVNLEKSLEEKNVEITDLKRSVNSLNDVLNSIPIDELRCNSSVASNKILELSTKNRQLRSELDNAKARCGKKESIIQKLQDDLRKLQEKPQTEDTAKNNPSPLAETQAKLNAMQQKFYEMRNRNIELQTQLKCAQKCIQQELGENVNVTQLLNSFSSHQPTWRGRAQQILHLQQKVKELRERLDGYERMPATGRSDTTLTSNMSQSQMTYDADSQNPIESGCTFDRFNPVVRKTEIQHRAKLEKMEKEINILKSQLEEQRNKALALKVRNKTLNDELADQRMRLMTLTKQTDSYQDKCLESIHERLGIQKNHYEIRINELTCEMEEAVKLRNEAEHNVEKMQYKYENVEDALIGKDTQIEKLNGVITKLESDMEALVGGFLFSCRDMRTNDFSTLLDTLESEKNQLCSLNKMLNERIDGERDKNENLNDQVAKQKIRIARLETKIRDLEKELDSQSERKKRTQRIAEYSNTVNNINSSFNGRSYTFENSSMTSLQSKKSLKDISVQQSISDLKHELQYSNEKIALLENKLGHLQDEKQKDLMTFEEIIDNTKERIVKALKQHNEDNPVFVENGGFEEL
ncbi:coiled-coil domain-containing protein 13 [Teleopsis dalmanni]|uniref:coiled-coil domain-containing protein 13 n=1 Tax=Teleopsis dalmanni TaxID=139649 RepID=UPI0018CDBFE8|nr:coiled-coil domain-containing protein 13 [Teleopsis dalmanni]